MNRDVFETSQPYTAANVYETTPNTTLDSFGRPNSPKEKNAADRKTNFVSEDVVDSHINANDAFDTFKDKQLSTFGVEDASVCNFLSQPARTEFVLEHTPGLTGSFSGSIDLTQRDKTQTEGKAILTSIETPLQRVTRLQMEIVDMREFLVSYLEDMKMSSEDSQTVYTKSRKELGGDPGLLLSDLDSLEKQLEGILADEALQNVFASTQPITTQRNALDIATKHLDKTLEEITALSAGKANDTSGAETKEALSQETKNVTYELYTVPSLKPLVDSGRLSALEQKIADLEGAIGVKNWAEVAFSFPDLNSGIRAIGKRLVTLDPNKLEVIGRRVQKLTNEIDALLHRKEKLLGLSTPSSLEDRQILELYEMCEKWKQSSVVLPVVIKRLQILKCLHQEAAAASSRLNVLESQQGDLAKLLELTATNLNSLKSAMADNVAWIRLSLEDTKQSVAILNKQNEGGEVAT